MIRILFAGLALATLAVGAAPAQADYWKRIWGPQHGASLYGLGTDNKIRVHRSPRYETPRWEVMGEPHKQRFDRIFVGFNYRNLKAREKGTKALWSLEWGDPPQREPNPNLSALGCVIRTLAEQNDSADDPLHLHLFWQCFSSQSQRTAGLALVERAFTPPPARTACALPS